MASDPSNTVQIQLTPITQGGYPNIVDPNFLNAVTAGKQGGDHTQSFFDATNQTSDFWGWMADHDGSETNPFIPGTDPQGNPIMMSSNGNVSMRMGAFYNDNAPASLAASEDDPPPVVGTATIQTGNTTTLASRDLSFGLTLLGIPAGLVITKALFSDLIGPIYSNMKTFVTKMAKQFQESSEVEDPSIDPEEESEEPLDETSGEIEDIGGELAEEGAEYMAIDWGTVGLEAAGLGAIAAIPIIVSFLGHKMMNSVAIINQTNLDFNWNVSLQDSGKASVLPKSDSGKIIPQMSYYTDMWGDKTTVQAAYEADFQFINSSDYGSIGYVLTLTPSDNGTPAQLVVSIPWAGDNTIWVGNSNDSYQTIYDTYSIANGKLSTSATFGNYQVTVSINKLSGETSGQYFYGVLAVIEPTS
jgi:hypothetical protein